MPRSLHDALTALDEDRGFLLKGEVFTDEYLDNWIETKRETEVRAVAGRPHPYEYHLYLDT